MSYTLNGRTYVGDPPPSDAVPIRCARRALLAANLLDDVEVYVATLPREDQVDWASATEVHRSYPLVLAYQQSRGLTDAQVDDLFTLARSFDF